MAAALVPNFTEMVVAVPVKYWPWMTTEYPPAGAPLVGKTASPLRGWRPPGVPPARAAAPACPAGVVTVNEVGEGVPCTGAGRPCTKAMAPGAKFEPTMASEPPPGAAGRVEGSVLVIAGA